MKSKQGIFVGCSENVNGYRVYYEKENTVDIEQSVVENLQQKYVSLDQDVTGSSEKDKVVNIIENPDELPVNELQNTENEENLY